MADCALGGYPLFVWWWSLINMGFIPADMGGTEGMCEEAPTEEGAVVDPEAGTMDVIASAPFAGAAAQIIVRASRPIPAGRIPSMAQTRMMGSIPVGTSTNIADRYVARFGRLPPAGTQVMFTLRVADPDQRRAGQVTNLVIVSDETPAGPSCAISLDTNVIDAFGFTNGSVSAFSPLLSEFDQWDVTLESMCIQFQGGVTVENGGTMPVVVEDICGTGGTFIVVARLVDFSGVAPDCTTEFTIEVLPF